ncbi:MAG TPA: 2Fe-2S iron-sulfur cluster-binding protein [Candidatus Binataceae bacterium]|nr:2Fe-2S iron-sulfur cluster-binding protein [Candidatus Binataceae bacterium]
MFKVTLQPAGRSFDCLESETILDAAFREGLRLPHGCRSGGCGSCKARLIEGEVDDSQASLSALMDYERAAGMTLLCSSYPESDVEIWLEHVEEDDTPPRYLDARVIDLAEIASGLFLIHLGIESSLGFRAGQYIEVNVPRTEEWRAYSLANPPTVRRELEILIKLVPGGLFSDYLAASRLKAGDILSIRGPYGNFALRPGEPSLLFITGGSGLAPVLSMLRELAPTETTRPIRLLYGARTRHDLCFVDELRGYEKEFADLKFVPVLSHATDDADWPGERGMVTEAISRWRHGDDLQAYLCGPPAMIDAALPILDRLGVPAHQIFFDKFLTRADLVK